MPVGEAKRRITHAEFVDWLAWFSLKAEISSKGPDVLERYQEHAEPILAQMDAALQRIASQSTK